MCELTDEELIARYKSGDNDALDELFVRHKALVSSIARTYFLTGGSNEDLVQEGMIGLHKAIVTFDKAMNTKFYSYAATCIRSAILDALKVANRDKHKALNDSISIQDVSPEYERSISPEEAIIDEEKHAALKKHIYSFLSSPQKKLLDLYLDGYTYTEIAEKMNKDVKYIDNNLQLIKRKIRKNLDL